VLPVVALVGRPNVGKSTLFNVLTRTRDALVADVPGLTRDRQYGYGSVGGRYIVIDTGGLVASPSGLEALMMRQTEKAIEEADVIVLVVDGRDGATPTDHFVAAQLRRAGKPVTVAVNKTEGREADLAVADFHALGLGVPHAISAAHGTGIAALIECSLAGRGEAAPRSDEAESPSPSPGEREPIRIAVIGRPNVGKSTLINRILGEERLVTFDQPGTTRDSVRVPFTHERREYLLIDTAGVRRRARVEGTAEKFSVVKALQAIDEAHVVLAVLDAHETVADQDASLLGLCAERGRALVIAVNKWDGIEASQRDHIRNQMALRLPFLDYAPRHFISALHGSGVGGLLKAARRAYEAAVREMPTPVLTRVLEKALEAHQPPLVRGRRIRLRYAHQGGRNPPLIVIHGNQVAHVPDAYRAYLMKVFREAFRLQGTPVRIEFRSDPNPFAGRKNELSERQAKQRKRLVRHARARR
jgi:GTP-binding protein